jgi:phosphoribosylformimino-5-aminoimidazole carboxamide ribotide isomerase
LGREVVASFEVIPAIDVLGGRCVRLTQGDYARSTIFFDDPADAAAAWTEAGARTIHVVDLDGAKAGHPVNLDALRAIRRASSATLHYGGGRRTDDAVDAALDAGADRIVVGTALLNNPDWVEHLSARFAERVVAGIDAKDGRVAVRGWLDVSDVTVADAVERANRIGLRRALFTDIAKDGTLEGPNLASLREAVALARFDVIASGGVATLDDLVAIQATGAAAAIVGRALYTGGVDLRAAIAHFAAPSVSA